jgi:hypothetical protein
MSRPAGVAFRIGHGWQSGITRRRDGPSCACLRKPDLECNAVSGATARSTFSPSEATICSPQH